MSDGVVRWGVLSTANINRKVVPATQAAERCEVVAIGSRARGRAEAAASEFGIARAYGSYDEVLADPEVDAVYIPLPNHLHAQWTIAAARARKHVLCEKPLAMTASDAERMISVCEAEGVLLMEAFMYRLHPTWEAVREITASGRIGELRSVQSWFSYFNDDPTDIRNIVEAGGGALFDVGCYSVNLSRMLFAAEPTGTQARVVRDPEMGIDVLTSAILDFPDGVATFTCSTRAEPDQRVHIYGTRGRISVEIPFNVPTDRPTRVFVAAGGDPPVSPDVETLTFEPADEYALQAARFASAVLDGTPVPVHPADAVANLRVIEEIFRVG
ncbi:MAG TPA: Gfo/Idh/MocA family oxidoreductase [Actinomycetota bacterium]|nr:Gfo/Idh/MocA family oxidoreductase [Actinomycetota bacterium]